MKFNGNGMKRNERNEQLNAINRNDRGGGAPLNGSITIRFVRLVSAVCFGLLKKNEKNNQDS